LSKVSFATLETTPVTTTDCPKPIGQRKRIERRRMRSFIVDVGRGYLPAICKWRNLKVD